MNKQSIQLNDINKYFKKFKEIIIKLDYENIEFVNFFMKINGKYDEHFVCFSFKFKTYRVLIKFENGKFKIMESDITDLQILNNINVLLENQ